jgi:hypothetical protein
MEDFGEENIPSKKAKKTPQKVTIDLTYQINMLTLFILGIIKTLYSWKSLHSHIRRILGTREEIFNIDAHNKIKLRQPFH